MAHKKTQAPAPVEEASTVPGTPEERRAELESDFEGLENRERQLNSQSALNKNKLSEVKSNVIRAMFQVLENMGVDPNNLESIREFLAKLAKQDPDLAAMFEIAFNGLAKDEAFQPPTAAAPPGPEAGLPVGQATNPIAPGGPGIAAPAGPPIIGRPGTPIDQPREVPFVPPQQ